MEEQKEYKVVGTVTIGTDEYRDLIEGLAGAKRDIETSNSARWSEYRRAEDANANLKKQTAKCEQYERFINSDDIIKARFKEFLAQELLNSQNENMI